MPVRQKWAVGAVVEIRLARESWAYAQMLEPPEFAFFSGFGEKLADPQKAAARDVVFRLWVHRSAYSHGRWTKVASSNVSPKLRKPVPRFKLDPISGKLTLYRNEVETPTSPSKCVGVECAAVWDAAGVEERLRNVRDGVPNTHDVSMRVAAGVPPSNTSLERSRDR